ncbi:hypothetical protein RN001_011790 [Aquatica leii]|uniref:Glycolipid transfer protein domain-containing protein n=1 Tax=Aquatica leii TaxID=1421715 RepID=A0AAN7SM63_9COLE|nr:hypothetical protein RN001_011790 [Aquatica leii]
MSKNGTYISLHQRPFPKPNSKIDTEEFLASCKDFVVLLDVLGKVFAPASYDMNGNIEKINNVYETNCDKHKYLEDMVLGERQEGNVLATDALMWLRRGLTFLLEFFDGLCSNTEEETNIVVKKAYAKTLKKYHGWFASNLFSILTRIIPQRTVLMKQLALGKQDLDEMVLSDIKDFTFNLRLCINHLEAFYNEHGLETEIKV